MLLLTKVIKNRIHRYNKKQCRVYQCQPVTQTKSRNYSFYFSNILKPFSQTYFHLLRLYSEKKFIYTIISLNIYILSTCPYLCHNKIIL